MNKSSVQIGCIYFLTCLIKYVWWKIHVHNLIMFQILFQILYVDMHIFFCIFLTNFPNISFLWIQNNSQHQRPLNTNSTRLYMAEILQIRRKTLSNQSFDGSNFLFKTFQSAKTDVDVCKILSSLTYKSYEILISLPRLMILGHYFQLCFVFRHLLSRFRERIKLTND